MSDPRTSSTTIHITELHCADELSLIKKSLRSVDGIQRLAPNYILNTLHVEFNSESVDPAQIAEHIRRIGFSAELSSSLSVDDDRQHDSPRLRATTISGGLLLVAAIVLQFLWPMSTLLPLLATVSCFSSGWPVAVAALRAVRLGRLDMNALMSIAAIGALLTAPTTSEWLEAPTAMFLFSIAIWLESFSVARARRAAQTLVELTPPVAHRIESASPSQNINENDVADVRLDQLAVGDYVLVKPGERIPIDGSVVSGISSVNQAPITGESMPIDKSTGERVYAGSLNGNGVIQIRADKPAHESTLAHISRLVEQAQSGRSPTERFVDRFARVYTPAVIALAMIIAFVPPLLAWSGFSWPPQTLWTDWFHRGLVLLVIACPCALVLSTPITIVCGLHRATRYGILLKGGEHLETAGRLDCIAIDKTGTLTVGSPTVARITTYDGRSENEVLSFAASLESGSEHPLAGAIVTAAKTRGLHLAPATEITAIRGFGVQGNIDGEAYFVGSPRMFLQKGIGGQIPAGIVGIDTSTVALVGTREKILGTIELSDEPRNDAKSSIDELRRSGVSKIVMLTGDNGAVATRMAQSLGIETVFAELMPEDKVKQVQALAADYPHLAMVGDGVNDAPALAASKLGIALGSQSSDTALETADVVVMSPRLSRLPQLVRLGRRLRAILTQNIALALTIKVAVLVLATLGLATMWMAVAADVGTSLLVIFNGMRLLHSDN